MIETVDRASLRLERFFDAVPETVFRAWTEPTELKRWWAVSDSHRTSVAEVDLRVGGSFRLGMEAGGVESIVRGEFTEVRPPHKLAYTWEWETAEDGWVSKVTVEFLAADGGTLVVLEHVGLSSERSAEEHETGWDQTLARLPAAIRP